MKLTLRRRDSIGKARAGSRRWRVNPRGLGSASRSRRLLVSRRTETSALTPALSPRRGRKLRGDEGASIWDYSTATGVVSLLLLLLSAGCASTKIDWNSRIGNYNYDQAVVELGPPDKSAKLTDGTRVAEWLTRRGYSGGSVGFMYGYGHPYYYHPWYHYYEPPSPDYFLRLTFAPDGKLRAYQRVAR